MNRRVVAGALGLALAGCAQDRTTSQGRGAAPGPVGMTTFPSIYDAVNADNPKADAGATRLGFRTHVEPGPRANGSVVTPIAATEPTTVAPGAESPLPVEAVASSAEPPAKGGAVWRTPSGPLPTAASVVTQPATPSPAPAEATPGQPPAIARATIPVSVQASPSAVVSADPSVGADPDALPPLVAAETGPASVAMRAQLAELTGVPPQANPSAPPFPATESGPAPEPLPSQTTQSPAIATNALASVPAGSESAPSGALSSAESKTLAAAPSAAKPDDGVRPTSNDATTVRSPLITPDMKEAGRAAARVGDEVITLHELEVMVKDRLKNIPQGEYATSEQVNMLASMVLAEMIERSMIVQEAKRELKNPKQLQLFMDQADKVWKEEELPPLLKKYSAANEFQLKERLAARGQSMDEQREAFRQNFLAQGYMKHKIGSKLSVSLPEMREYYNEHLKEFDRPALLTWREVVIDVMKAPSRTAAKRKAENALARLRAGEDFAKVAAELSDGPNRKTGGLWETSPGGYAVETVSRELDSLPIGQVSRVIESPESYHIIRVESRRAAGPASFAEPEVQASITRSVHNMKAKRETDAFLDKLRRHTVVSTIFDGTASDPGVNQTSGPPSP